nr:immunoglobulin light chain junction region [Macaca mulatta]
CMQGTHFPFTF